MRIFIVNGQGGTGKTTFEEYVCKAAEEQGEKVCFYSIINVVKGFAEKCLDWRGEKDEKARLMLSRLKDLLDDWDDSPYQSVCAFLRICANMGYEAVFIDARESKDIERLKKDFIATSILITRGDQKTYGNHADDDVFSIDYDITLNNNGTLKEWKSCAEGFYHFEIHNQNN